MAENPPLTLKVDCYAGYRGEETPRRFTLGDRTYEVKEVVDRWTGPDHRYFRILADDGGTYIIRHDVESGLWQLTMFDSRPMNR